MSEPKKCILKRYRILTPLSNERISSRSITPWFVKEKESFFATGSTCACKNDQSPNIHESARHPFLHIKGRNVKPIAALIPYHDITSINLSWVTASFNILSSAQRSDSHSGWQLIWSGCWFLYFWVYYSMMCTHTVQGHLIALALQCHHQRGCMELHLSQYQPSHTLSVSHNLGRATLQVRTQ